MLDLVEPYVMIIESITLIIMIMASFWLGIGNTNNKKLYIILISLCGISFLGRMLLTDTILIFVWGLNILAWSFIYSFKFK